MVSSSTMMLLALLAVISLEATLARPSFLGGTSKAILVPRQAAKSTISDGISSLESFELSELRGGAAITEGEGDEYDDEYDEYDDEYEQEDDNSNNLPGRTSAGNSPISSVVNSLLSTTKSLIRAVTSIIAPPTTADGEDGVSLVGRLMAAVQNMFGAATELDDGSSSESKPKKAKASSKKSASTSSSSSSSPTTTADFGAFLSQAYGVADGRDTSDGATPSPILGGTLNDALKIARSNARLLVILIPSAGPNKKNKNDLKAIESFLSSDVAKQAKKKARKKGETASFVLWGTKAGSAEATMAMKRLKVKATSAKGDKRPVLLVAYAAQGISSQGIPKIAPKVLAQHHCSPPPSTESMAQWMNELRKRFSKQYATMQLELTEVQLYQERKDGYKSSVQDDVERKVREKKEEAERLAKEEAEKDRLETLEKRREEFIEALPEEPDAKATDSITLSVRSPDGRSEKRRFAPNTQLSVIFNWVDGTFKMEREVAVLTTMNGKQTFSWDDASEEKTLKEAGLGRMVGFRVTEKKEEEKDDSSDEDNSKAVEEDA